MADVKFAVVNASSVASGTQDFTSSGFGTPKGAIFFMNGVTADGIADHGRYAIGAWDAGTSSFAVGFAVADGGAVENTGRRGSVASNRIIWIPTAADGTWAEADYSATVTDGVRISWVTSPGAGYHLSCILIGGADASVVVGSFQTNASTTPKTITTGIDQKLVFLTSCVNNAVEETSSVNGHYTFVHGWAQKTGPATMGIGTTFNDGSANGDPRGGFSNNRTGFYWANGEYECENFTSTSFDFTSKGSSHYGLFWYYIAIDTGDLTIFNDAATTPTSTGDWQRTGYGMTPQIVFGYMVGENDGTGVNTQSLHSTDLDGVACNSIFASDGTTDFCYGCSDEDNAATIQAQSVGTQSGVFLQYDDTAATKHAEGTVSSFDSDGVTFNFTTAVAARYVNFFAISAIATTQTKTASLNAALAKEFTSTSSLNAALAKQLFATASLNARFQKEILLSTTMNAFLSFPAAPGRATPRRTFRPLTARTFKPRIS